MFVNPFPERFDMHIEIGDNTDMNMLEEYICSAFNGKIFNISVVDKDDVKKEKYERLEQFCKARNIMLNNSEYRNCDKYDVKLWEAEDGWRNKYNGKCFVMENHAYLDAEGNIFPCRVAKESGVQSMNSIAKYMSQKAEYQKLNKEYEEKHSPESESNLKEFYERIQKEADDWMDKNIQPSGICGKCSSIYQQYNNFMIVLNEYNNDFNVGG